MGSGLFTGWHLLIVLAVVVLLFGAAKLPTLAKSVGQSMRIFKGEMKTMKDESAAKDSTAASSETASSETETSAEKAEHGSQPKQ